MAFWAHKPPFKPVRAHLAIFPQLRWWYLFMLLASDWGFTITAGLALLRNRYFELCGNFAPFVSSDTHVVPLGTNRLRAFGHTSPSPEGLRVVTNSAHRPRYTRPRLASGFTLFLFSVGPVVLRSPSYAIHSHSQSVPWLSSQLSRLARLLQTSWKVERPLRGWIADPADMVTINA